MTLCTESLYTGHLCTGGIEKKTPVSWELYKSTSVDKYFIYIISTGNFHSLGVILYYYTLITISIYMG